MMINKMLYGLIYTIYISWLYYQMSNIYIILLLFTNDNILISYNYLCDIYNFKYKIHLYTDNYIDRYIYYISLILIKILIHILLYTKEDYLLNYLILLSTLPTLLQYILNFIDPFLTLLKSALYNIKMYIIYDFIKYIITIICITTINYDPYLTKEEITFLLEQNHKDNFYSFIRSFLVLSIIQTIANGNTYTLRLLKTVYNNNNNIKYSDPYPTIRSDIKKIKQIIKQRKWDQFCNPYVVNLMTKIYNERQTETIIPGIEAYFKLLELAFAKLFIIITIGKLMISTDIKNFHYIAILFTSYLINRNDNMMDFMIKIFGLIIGHYYDNYYLFAFICEYGKLLFGNIAKWSYHKLKIFFNKNIYRITEYNVYNYYIIYNILLCCLPINIYTYIFIILNAKYPLITSWFMFGSFSNFNIIHMILLAIILYFIINIYHIKDEHIGKIKILYITNYDSKITPVAPKTHKIEKIGKIEQIVPIRNAFLLNSMYNPINNKVPL